MKVVALISGGKDSCYSMLLCQKHGHEVVALANLLPCDRAADELDSYMYQTVGHQLVAAYASCTGLPLYRRAITGGSLERRLSYRRTDGDEVEDLYCLLAHVKAKHPDVTAVASGAIASDYQRTRVEHVAARLGLTSLAFMWRQPQDALLRGMIGAGVDAVLVKVAAIGLSPRAHLGKSLEQLAPHLRRLAREYGCNVCGEGGEYETLTLDCPMFAAARLALDGFDVVLHSPDAIAPVGVLHATAFRTVPKGGGEGGGDGSAAAEGAAPAPVVVEVPLEWRPASDGEDADAAAAAATAAAVAAAEAVYEAHVALRRSNQHLHVTCSPTARDSGRCAASADATASALHAALAAVSHALERAGAAWSDALFVHLYLADMAHFGAANAAYCAHLPRVDPPSRACVQLPALPRGAPLLLDVLLLLPDAAAALLSSPPPPPPPPPPRRVLHVQSVSSWAPSCIGPYSQATSAAGLIHMAGQIPLDPASMAIITDSSGGGSARDELEPQLWRALRSCQAVAVALRACAAAGCLALTIYLVPEAAAGGGRARAERVVECSRADPGVLSNGDDDEGGGGGGSDDGDGDDEDEAVVDAYLLPVVVATPTAPPVVYVTVPALPRGALVEVQPLLRDLGRLPPPPSSSSSSSGGDGDEAEAAAAAAPASFPPFASCAAPESADAARHIDVSETRGERGFVRLLLSVRLEAAAACREGSSVERALAAAIAARLTSAAQQARLSAGGVASLRCWWRVEGDRALDASELRTALERGLDGAAVQVVPVLGVSTSPQPELDLVCAVEVVGVSRHLAGVR